MTSRFSVGSFRLTGMPEQYRLFWLQGYEMEHGQRCKE